MTSIAIRLQPARSSSSNYSMIYLARWISSCLRPSRRAPRATIAKPINILNPSIKIGGEDYILLAQQMVSVRRNSLKEPIGNAAAERYAILRAIDMMFTGI